MALITYWNGERHEINVDVPSMENLWTLALDNQSWIKEDSSKCKDPPIEMFKLELKGNALNPKQTQDDKAMLCKMNIGEMHAR